MEKATKTTLPSATIRNLIFGLACALLVLFVIVGMGCYWCNTKTPVSESLLAMYVSILFSILSLSWAVPMSIYHIKAYFDKTTFDLYELNLMDITNVKETLDAIQKDHIIMRQDSWGFTYVKREDFNAYCDWALLHYRPKTKEG